MVSDICNEPVFVISEVDYAETVILDPGSQEEVRVRQGNHGNRHLVDRNGVLLAARDTKLKLDAFLKSNLKLIYVLIYIIQVMFYNYYNQINFHFLKQIFKDSIHHFVGSPQYVPHCHSHPSIPGWQSDVED